MRNLMLGSILEGGDLGRVSLLLIVNANKNSNKRAYYDGKLAELKDALMIPASQLSLCSWHDLVPWAKQFGKDFELVVEKLESNPLLRSVDAVATWKETKLTERQT
jgi:hypothetical protein